MHAQVSVAFCLLVCLAGCAAPVAEAPATGERTLADADGDSRPDVPSRDALGWEQGYWYDDSLDIDQSDGLNDTEREALVARTMARVERIRGLEFRRPIPVEVVSRAAYRNESSGIGPAPSDWNDQVWEALFLVGEDEDVSAVFDELYGGSVLGYYSPSDNRIVVVSDAEQPTLNSRTLAHELLHALQDQHFRISNGARTTDAALANRALVEGDARYLDSLYAERCGSEWQCLAPPGPDQSSRNVTHIGVYTAIYFPYADGPRFVHATHQRGGWAAVNRLYERRPTSTEQVIHPEAYPHERPVRLSVRDRSGPQWRQFDRRPNSDTVGEASLFVTLWANGVIPRSHLTRETGAHSAYNYSHPATAGWAGDAVVPYRRGSGDDAEYGYVFRSRWDTAADARAFAAAYRALLAEHGAETRGGGVYVVATGPYADAFRVTRTGSTVTVVNAPTVAALDGVHGGTTA